MNTDLMMLRAISSIGKAKALKSTSKPLALIELAKSISLMNRAIKIDPGSIENRKYRLRHLMGVTMSSPKKCDKEIIDDLKFFESNFETLNYEDKAYYLSALGEYEIYNGNKDIGIKYLYDVINTYPNSDIFEYTKVYLESIETRE